MEKFAAIDFETANGKRSSVCSVGVAIVENGEVTDSIYRIIRPNPNYFMPWTTAIHGLSSKDTKDAQKFPEVWEEVAPYIEGLPLIAHNSPFDEACLKSVFKLYEMEYPKYQFYCSCKLARKAFPRLLNHKLNTVAAHCGYNLTNHHHAMADAYACAHIAVTLMERKGVTRLADL
ncbi:MAG: 3'-5' exonuclease [Bacteroides sp.]|nr:3'-5' exonuclease [Bacteroides sp.]